MWILGTNLGIPPDLPLDNALFAGLPMPGTDYCMIG